MFHIIRGQNITDFEISNITFHDDLFPRHEEKEGRLDGLRGLVKYYAEATRLALPSSSPASC